MQQAPSLAGNLLDFPLQKLEMQGVRRPNWPEVRPVCLKDVPRSFFVCTSMRNTVPMCGWAPNILYSRHPVTTMVMSLLHVPRKRPDLTCLI